MAAKTSQAQLPEMMRQSLVCMQPKLTKIATHQQQFHQQWGHLQNPHVRALAWLIFAPNLLNADSPRWAGKIATLTFDVQKVTNWLLTLEHDPTGLLAYLAIKPTFRLGRYAEQLLTFYFGWSGTLVAHGLQVKEPNGATIGEFDFLVQQQALMHIELATKFYLFAAASQHDVAENFIGPNFADTLGAKMDKILKRQLALSSHRAAQAYLPQPVTRAQALIKGWLFYRDNVRPRSEDTGVAADHCYGFWCSLSEFCEKEYFLASNNAFIELKRLMWLAPTQAAPDCINDHQKMADVLRHHFAADTTPVMVAVMRANDSHELMQESERGFIVPDDWRARVEERNQRTVLHW